MIVTGDAMPKNPKRDIVLVFVLALAVRTVLALPQAQPGYMDAYYYTVSAQQLATGRGFTEPFIWNYLDNPSGLPRPSHQYWMPLPSILAALAMRVGGINFRAAQAPFILLSALLAVIACIVAWQTSMNRRHIWATALFAMFSGFYVYVWSLPETFTPFAVFGAVCLWAAGRSHRWGFIAGACAGLAHLTRADGVLLLLPALLVPFLNRGRITSTILNGLGVLLGYALVTGPWLAHNWSVTGRPLSTAGAQTLFLTNYDDLYSFGKPLNLQTYLAWGIGNIVRSKLNGLWLNFQTLFAVDGLIFLAPFAIIGFWQRRRDSIYCAALLYGAALYLVMSLAFTFPGVRGGMFHSSAALLPFIFSAAMIGLDAAINWAAARRTTWNVTMARRVFTGGLIALAIMLSGMIYLPKVRGWNQADAIYDVIGARLSDQPSAIVMVNNPPGYVYHTGQRAIAIPNGDVDTLLAAARRYGAEWIVLDANRPAALAALYERPQSDSRLTLVEIFRADSGRPVYLFKTKGQ